MMDTIKENATISPEHSNQPSDSINPWLNLDGFSVKKPKVEPVSVTFSHQTGKNKRSRTVSAPVEIKQNLVGQFSKLR
jgi:hypothetical protein